MSEEITSLRSCASCGIAEIDDIKLKDCSACDLVRYCSDDCKLIHKSQHNEECRERAAELRDELLFKQPEGTHLGDCPICSLPLPLDLRNCTFAMCCSKIICNGCRLHANQVRGFEASMDCLCPYCREPAPETKEESDKQKMKRVAANDPFALREEGTEQYNKGDYISAFEYWTKAAELGDADAHCKLAILYNNEEGVEEDRGKEIYHFEQAAIGGHPYARYNLGFKELEKNHDFERAAKHWVIAATQGHNESIEQLTGMFKAGLAEKEELAAALRAHQAAVDATKSPQRDEAEEIIRANQIAEAAESRDELLFKQPESSYLGDCPICCLPMPVGSTCLTCFCNCCSKTICIGCDYEYQKQERGRRPSCAFCRQPLPKIDKEYRKQRMKRIEANDPAAMCQEGKKEQHEKGNYRRAFEYYAKAAALGNVEAQCNLGYLYHVGQGVEKDRVKKMYYLEEAAIGGHPEARYNLGCEEWSNGNAERAVKHWIIAVKQGYDKAVKQLMNVFKAGIFSKEDLAAALRAHQAALDATKSPQRELAHRMYSSRQMKF